MATSKKNTTLLSTMSKKQLPESPVIAEGDARRQPRRGLGVRRRLRRSVRCDLMNLFDAMWRRMLRRFVGGGEALGQGWWWAVGEWSRMAGAVSPDFFSGYHIRVSTVNCSTVINTTYYSRVNFSYLSQV